MPKTAIRNTLIQIIAPISKRLNREYPRIRVLALHDISRYDQEVFRKKMRWLKDCTNVISLRHAYQRKNINIDRINVALTFDDGFACYSTLVAPVLREFQLPATFFVPSDSIGISGEKAKLFSRDNLKRSIVFDFMKVEDCIALAKDPLFEIGGHTRSHIDLGEKLPDEILLKEIWEDKTNLEKIIGKQVNSFAYPFGAEENVCEKSAVSIADAGYKVAFTIVPSFWKIGADQFRLGRDSLSIHDSDELWQAWFDGGYDRLSWLKNFVLFKIIKPLKEKLRELRQSEKVKKIQYTIDKKLHNF